MLPSRRHAKQMPGSGARAEALVRDERYEQPGRMLPTPVQDASASTAGLVVRWKVTKQRVAGLKVASSHHQPKFIPRPEDG